MLEAELGSLQVGSVLPACRPQRQVLPLLAEEGARPQASAQAALASRCRAPHGTARPRHAGGF